MNKHRRIQLAAAAATVNSALALGLLSGSPAFATTCNDEHKAFCVPAGECIGGASYCPTQASPGCTYTSFKCAYPIMGGGCPPGTYVLACNYD
jgi:hypothetical protein